MHAYAEIPFKFEMPIDTWQKAGAEGSARRIGGVISTESKDRQGEVVLQRGLDFSEFLRNGWFNDNHSKDIAGVLGYPVKVEKVQVNGKPAHKVEGYLLEGYEPADRIWKLAQSLQKTGRRLGFSIEGAVRQRAGSNDNVIAEAVVRNVAITHCPVNTDTGLDVLAKSMLAIERATQGPNAVQKALEQLHRALMAGGALTGGSPVAGDGGPLRTESLEGGPVRRKKRLRKSEARRFVQARYPGMTEQEADRVLRFACA